MKYKVMLTGNNGTIINEFFTYMDYRFECISTSDRHDDIMNHLKYIEPDIFVYCLYRERLDDLKRFANVGWKIAEKNIPLAIMGDEEDCETFRKIAPMLDVAVFQKPFTSKSIEEGIIKLLEERKQEEEQKAAEQQTDENSDVTASSDKADNKEEEDDTETEEMKHILIVDDDSNVLKMIKNYLSGRYQVATAISGKVAMKFLETRKTDLVLLDYEMPVENGPAVLSQIRSNDKTKDLPVVFLTGVTDKKKIQEVLALKPQGYLLKPIDIDRLSSTIKGILN